MSFPVGCQASGPGLLIVSAPRPSAERLPHSLGRCLRFEKFESWRHANEKYLIILQELKSSGPCSLSRSGLAASLAALGAQVLAAFFAVAADAAAFPLLPAPLPALLRTSVDASFAPVSPLYQFGGFAWQRSELTLLHGLTTNSRACTPSCQFPHHASAAFPADAEAAAAVGPLATAPSVRASGLGLDMLQLFRGVMRSRRHR